jgi:hypothetical protein
MGDTSSAAAQRLFDCCPLWAVTRGVTDCVVLNTCTVLVQSAAVQVQE